MSNNIYDILSKLNGLKDQQEQSIDQTQNTVYEEVQPQGDLIKAIESMVKKYEDFVAEENKQLDERQFSDKKTFDKLAEPGDTYKTADGGTVTKTEKGIKHSAPKGRYGAGPEDEKDELDEKAVNPYAVGMAQAMKSTGDEPPLKKSTIKKAHKIAKAVDKQDESVETKEEILNEGDDYFVHATELTNYEIVVNANSEEEAEDKAVEQIEADREEYQAGGDGVIPQYADKLEESKEDIRNHPIYTKEEAWEQYSKELAEQEQEETVDINTELDEISRLAGLAEKVGGNKVYDFVDDVQGKKDKEDCDEGFDPKEFEQEIEYEFTGDDGEPGYGHVHCKVNVVDGHPVVDPTSLKATCRGDGNNKLTDEWCSEMVAIGGSEHEEALKACQEEADEQWADRDVDVPMGEEQLEEGPTRKDFQMVADLLKNIEDEAKKKELANHHADMFAKQNPRFDKARFLSAVGLNEEEVEEGNEFTKARLDAIKAGKDSFTVDGKTYKVSGDTKDEKMSESKQVNEDININVSASGAEDVINLARKLAGLPPIVVLAGGADEQVAPMEEEREIEHANTPREQVAGLSASIPNGTDLNRSKLQDPATANKAANPLAEKELEESLWTEYQSMIAEVKKDENA